MSDDTTIQNIAEDSADPVIEQIIADADTRIEADEYDQALEILHYALRRPEFDIRVYQKCAFVLRMLGRHEAAELYERVVADKEDPEAYFQLGYQLVQESHFGSALGPLSRCVKLAPEAPAANYEFAYSLMKEFFNEEALHFFGQAYEKEQAMSITFYIAQLLTFLGRTDEATAFVRKLEEQVAEANGEGQLQLAYLKGMLDRYKMYPAQNIRDWHFVQYGSLLLRTFEDDHPEEENVSNGRYAFVNFTYQQVADVLVLFKNIIGNLRILPEYNYVAPAGVTSQPLAQALGQLLKLPVISFAEGLSSDDKGIIISSFSDELDQIGADVWQRDDILLFSFSLSWTHEANVLPEVIGYLAQVPRLPWQQKVQFSEVGEPQMVPADERPVEQIANEILQQIPTSNAIWAKKVSDYFKQRETALAIGKQLEVPRKKFFIHSALGGARY